MAEVHVRGGLVEQPRRDALRQGAREQDALLLAAERLG